MRIRIHTILYLLVIAVSSGNPANAQNPAGSFEELRSRVGVGETLKVRDISAQEFKGRMTDLSGSGLDLTVSGATRSFTESQVREIWRQERDPVANGVLIGLAAGIGGGLLTPGFFCGGFGDSECGTIVRVIFVPIGAGAGAVSGWLVDLAMKRAVLVFSRRGSAQFRLTPLLSETQTGIRLDLKF